MTEQNTANQLFSILNQLRSMNCRKRFHPDVPHGEYFMMAAISECIERKREITPGAVGVTASELAARLDATPSAVSKMLKILEQKYWIRRIPDPRDRRILYLQPTEQGCAVLAQSEQSLKAFTLRLAERMGEKDVEQLVFLLKKLYRIVKEEYKEDCLCSK